MSGPLARELIVVADAHLEQDDPEVEAFTAFLREVAAGADDVVLLGDVFSLWLGAPQYTGPHHTEVLDCCRALRRAGTRVVFVEGNREFDTSGWKGDAFDAVGQRWTPHDWAGRQWLMAHGDVIDPEDTGNRIFRRVVRSPAVLGLFRRLPARAGLSFGHWLERRLRHRNLGHKTRIDEAKLARYGDWLAARGFDAGVIGHLHVELLREYPDARGVTHPLMVLPDWRTTHRFLRVDGAGEARFETWGDAPAAGPAIVAVRESGATAEVRLEPPSVPPVGTTVSVCGGHGPQARRGCVREVADREPGWIGLELEPGPPLQVGDRITVEHSGGISAGRSPA